MLLENYDSGEVLQVYKPFEKSNTEGYRKEGGSNRILNNQFLILIFRNFNDVHYFTLTFIYSDNDTKL